MSTEETVENEHDEESSEEESSSSDLAAVESPEGTTPEGAGKRTLGVDRWVQLVYFVGALALIWLFDHLISSIWYIFADPNESIVTVLSVAAGLVTAISAYRNMTSHALVHDVVAEMANVTWPTRKETSSSTVVVVITSIVAALMLFLFDSVWSAVTDLVYKV